MAITLSNLITATGSTSNASSYNTASITPTADRVIIASVCTYTGSAIDDSMTISGCGLTWTKIGSAQYATDARITVWWGTSPSPTTGAITFTTGSANNACWYVCELTTNNLTSPIVQSKTGTNGSKVSSLTITLDDFTSTDNATFGCFVTQTSDGCTITEGSGFTKVADYHTAESGGQIAVEWKNSNDTTVDIARSGSGSWEGVAFEVALNPTSASFFQMF